jgi:hypothetical protein
MPILSSMAASLFDDVDVEDIDEDEDDDEEIDDEEAELLEQSGDTTPKTWDWWRFAK